MTPPRRRGLKGREVSKLLEQIDDRERLRQVEAWLRENFPTVRPVKQVRVEKIAGGFIGDCYATRGGGLMVRVQRGQDRAHAVETLFHEWAHTMTFPTRYLQSRVGDDALGHPDAFWVAYGQVYRRWHDKKGWRRSAGY